MNYSPPRIIAALWALLVGALHVLWATGSSAKLAQWASAGQSTLLAYDLVVATACLVAMLMALLGGRTALLITGTVLSIKGAVGVALFMIDIATPASPVAWIDPAFLAGGLVFVVAGLRRWSNGARFDRNKNVALNR